MRHTFHHIMSRKATTTFVLSSSSDASSSDCQPPSSSTGHRSKHERNDGGKRRDALSSSSSDGSDSSGARRHHKKKRKTMPKRLKPTFSSGGLCFSSDDDDDDDSKSSDADEDISVVHAAAVKKVKSKPKQSKKKKKKMKKKKKKKHKVPLSLHDLLVARMGSGDNKTPQRHEPQRKSKYKSMHFSSSSSNSCSSDDDGDIIPTPTKTKTKTKKTKSNKRRETHKKKKETEKPTKKTKHKPLLARITTGTLKTPPTSKRKRSLRERLLDSRISDSDDDSGIHVHSAAEHQGDMPGLDVFNRDEIMFYHRGEALILHERVPTAVYRTERPKASELKQLREQQNKRIIPYEQPKKKDDYIKAQMDWFKNNMIVEVPGFINTVLRDYQREGVQFLFDALASGHGCILGDDMGLGKTVQMIAFLYAVMSWRDGTIEAERDSEPNPINILNKNVEFQRRRGHTKPVLIVVPASLTSQWKDEFHTFAPDIRVRIHSSKTNALEEAENNAVDAVVISYESLRLNRDTVYAVEWEVVVFDEVHRLKNDGNETYRSCKDLPCKLSAPEILIVQLKRFYQVSPMRREKLSTFVDFPIRGLDLSPYLASRETSTETPVYDLYAVSNHHGSTGGGHYTAYAKNFENSKWYLFDDSRTVETNVNRIKTNSAYVLFYRKRH